MEQIEKCRTKISLGDYDGSITNARSLVEAVLAAIEKEFDSTAPSYDGDLSKLYKRVQKHLNLSPENPKMRIVLGKRSAGSSALSAACPVSATKWVTGTSGSINRRRITPCWSSTPQ
jgi:hypothetical protein